MIKRVTMSILAALFVLAVSSVAFADYKVGDSVDVKWKGTWYPAKVIEVKKDQWKIHYDGYGSNWDEWVKKDRIRPRAAAGSAPIAPGSWKAGDKVQVEWKGSWYPAEVLEVKDGKYKIHYDGYGSEWDEWVGTSRMKAR